MANVFSSGTVTKESFYLNQVANMSVKYFADRFMPLTVFQTDFSPEIASRGFAVTTRLVNSITAKQLTNKANDASYDRTYDAYSPDDVSSTPITVQMGLPQGVVFTFPEDEVAFAGNLQWLRDNFMEPAMEGLLQRVFSGCIPLLVEQNIIGPPATGNAVQKANATERNNSVVPTADFDVDTLIQLNKKLTNRKVPLERRSIICTPDYFAKIVADDKIIQWYASQDTTAIRQGRLPISVVGFNVFELRYLGSNAIQTTAIPDFTSDPASTNTNTFQNTTLDKNFDNATDAQASSVQAAEARKVNALAVHPASMVLVARQVPHPNEQGPGGLGYGAIENRVEESSGLPLQFRMWHDMNRGVYNISISTMVGFGIGNPRGYERIVDSLSSDKSGGISDQLDNGVVA